MIAKRVVAAVMVLALVGWAASVLAVRAGRWLHARPEYAVWFDRVRLDPPPPAYVRRGQSTILNQVREKARIDGPISILDQDPDEFGRLFAKYSPWVVKVERVLREYPDRVTVQLAYREPVAWIEGQGHGAGGVAVSADGVVLPGSEVTAAVVPRLVRLESRSMSWNAIPGRLLAMDHQGKVAAEVVAALRLARFLRSQDAAAEGKPQIAKIMLDNGPDELMARTRNNVAVFWRHAPGDEVDDEPKADEKLQRITKWEVANEKLAIGWRDVLTFTPDDVKLEPAD